MRAIEYRHTGAASDVLRLVDLPEPHPGRGEVRVRVRFSGVNPGDDKKRADWAGFGMPFPSVVPHSDGAGIVDEVGPGVDGARLGRRVWVWGAQSYRQYGTAAEFVVVPEHLAVDLPDGVGDALGACLGIPGITAHRAVFADGPVSGRVVVVQGMLGAVGGFAAALARRGGAHVIGTVRRSSDLPAAAGLADAVVALDDDPAGALRDLAPGGVDRIVEVALASNVGLDLAIAANGATIAAYGTDQSPVALPFWDLLFKNVTLRMLGSDGFPPDARAAAIAELTAAAADGALPVRIAEPLPLAECARAHELVARGNRERILLRIPN